jgi:hypothetical protein
MAPNDSLAATTAHDPEIQAVTDGADVGNSGVVGAEWLNDKDVVPTEDAQHGVQKMEAVTLAWTKKSLAAMLIS